MEWQYWGGALGRLRRTGTRALDASEPVWFVLVWRLALLLFAALVAPLGMGSLRPASLREVLVRSLDHWDAGWYLTIAKQGYWVTNGQSSVAFYPLLPLLIRATHLVVPSWRAAGALVVHAALVAGLLYLGALVQLDYDRNTARRTIAFLLLFPTAIFLGAIYTESLILLTLTASIFHARRGQWWAAGLWGAAAGLTKMVGGVVVVPLLWEYWRGGWWRCGGRHAPWRVLPALALVPLGALAYLAWLQIRFGSYQVYFATMSSWFRGSFFHPFIPDGWRFLQVYLRGEDSHIINYFYPQGRSVPSTHIFMVIDLTFLLVGLLTGVVLCWKVRGSYGLLVLAILGVCAFSGSPQSLNRYVLPLFPLPLGFALAARRPVIGFGLLVLSALLCAFFAFLFINDYWAG